MEHRERFRGRKIGVVISGGNIDLEALKSFLNEVRAWK
jgi:threonine dehydratase